MSSADEEDAGVLAEMAASGHDMSQSMLIEFAIAAADERSAIAIDAALIAEGYESEVYFDDGEPGAEGDSDEQDPELGPSWTVYVRVTMIPTHDEIVRVQAHLDRLARPHGGYSEGWGGLIR